MKPRTAVGGVLVAAALALPAAAQQAAESGAEAFARSDFAAAAELWRKEAAAGSAQAKFGLGLISDLGLGVPRDAAKALRWYLEAADDGFSNAQFNVAVMLDAGTGVPRDVGAAAVWYGRAAANGHHRAQYNLGLLYEAGEGVPQNPDLARYWLGRAAEVLPAAAERLAKLAPARSDRAHLHGARHSRRRRRDQRQRAAGGDGLVRSPRPAGRALSARGRAPSGGGRDFGQHRRLPPRPKRPRTSLNSRCSPRRYAGA